MAWIAFASVPTILVVMLAMGQIEERLLPQTPPPNGEDEPPPTTTTPTPTPTPTPTVTLPLALAPTPVPADADGRAARPAAGAPRWEIEAGPAGDREEART